MPGIVIKATKNTFFNFLNVAFLFISGAFLSIMIARYLGAELLGQYSFITYLVALVVTIFTLGLPPTLTKYISEYTGKDDEVSISYLIVSVIKILLVSSLIAFLVFFICINTIVPPDLKAKIINYTVFASILVIPTLCAGVFKSIVSGFQDFSYLLKINLISSVSLVSLTIFVVISNMGITGLLIVNSLINILLIILIYRKYKKLIIPHKNYQINFDYRRLLEIYKFIWPVAIISIIDLIVWQYSETIFLGLYRTTEEIAFYAIPFSISFMVMSSLPGAFIGTLIPLLSNFYGKNSYESIKNIFYTSLKYVTYLVIPICFAISFLSSPIISILYGSTYQTASNILPALIFSAGFGNIAAVGACLLYSIKKQMVILKLMIPVLFINILLDIVLIPSYGIYGAAIANVTAQVASATLTLFFAFRVYKKFIILPNILKSLLSAFFMSIFIYTIMNYNNSIFGVITSIVGGTLIYLFFLSILKSLNLNDKNILLELGKLFPNRLQLIYNAIIEKLIYYEK